MWKAALNRHRPGMVKPNMERPLGVGVAVKVRSNSNEIKIAFSANLFSFYG